MKNYKDKESFRTDGVCYEKVSMVYKGLGLQNGHSLVYFWFTVIININLKIEHFLRINATVWYDGNGQLFIYRG